MSKGNKLCGSSFGIDFLSQIDSFCLHKGGKKIELKSGPINVRFLSADFTFIDSNNPRIKCGIFSNSDCLRSRIIEIFKGYFSKELLEKELINRIVLTKAKCKKINFNEGFSMEISIVGRKYFDISVYENISGYKTKYKQKIKNHKYSEYAVVYSKEHSLISKKIDFKDKCLILDKKYSELINSIKQKHQVKVYPRKGLSELGTFGHSTDGD